MDEAKNAKRCLLKVLTGPSAGKKLEMKKPLVTLGRPGKQVAVVSRRPTGYFFTFVEGAGQDSDYPLINNEPSGPQTRMLNDSDIIKLAGVQIKVLIRD